jgi:mRNA-degrading endonuclease YafQ of YafQ-DinJ toxin-antitoxin module
LKVLLTERFLRDVRDLDAGQRRAVFDAILALPAAMGDPHTHAGLGLRKLHRSGIWEARVGLGLRLVFGLQPDLLALVRVGSHEDVRRFLKEL